MNCRRVLINKKNEPCFASIAIQLTSFKESGKKHSILQDCFIVFDREIKFGAVGKEKRKTSAGDMTKNKNPKCIVWSGFEGFGVIWSTSKHFCLIIDEKYEKFPYQFRVIWGRFFQDFCFVSDELGVVHKWCHAWEEGRGRQVWQTENLCVQIPWQVNGCVKTPKNQ